MIELITKVATSTEFWSGLGGLSLVAYLPYWEHT